MHGLSFFGYKADYYIGGGCVGVSSYNGLPGDIGIFGDVGGLGDVGVLGDVGFLGEVGFLGDVAVTGDVGVTGLIGVVLLFRVESFQADFLPVTVALVVVLKILVVRLRFVVLTTGVVRFVVALSFRVVFLVAILSFFLFFFLFFLWWFFFFLLRWPLYSGVRSQIQLAKQTGWGVGKSTLELRMHSPCWTQKRTHSHT